MATTIAPPPLQSFLMDRDASGRWNGLMTRAWVSWLTALVSRLQQAAGVLNVVSLTDQSAAISPTDVAVQSIATGLYRLTWYARITRAATTNSSLTVTIGWTDGTVSCTTSGAAITGNTTTTIQSGTVLVQADSASPLTYSTAYSSTGATSMQYALSVVTEQVN
jgi:hypothetical protein